MSEPVTDAEHAIAIARKYAKSTATYLYWKDVIEVRSSQQRREAIRKGYEFVEKDAEGVSWYRKPKTD